MLNFSDNTDIVIDKEKRKKTFIILKCKNCKIQISKNRITNDLFKLSMIEDHYSIKPIFLTCYLIKDKTKMFTLGEGNHILKEEVTCVKCEKSIGLYIKSAGKNNWALVDNVALNTNFVQM